MEKGATLASDPDCGESLTLLAKAVLIKQASTTMAWLATHTPSHTHLLCFLSISRN
jgi:hypothetical protein